MSEACHVIYSPAALEDLESIYSYIALELQAPQAAQGQVNRIRDSIRKLDAFPGKFAVVDWEPWQSAGMRQMPVDNFIVYYLVNSDASEVSIVRIFYSGRDVSGIIASESE